MNWKPLIIYTDNITGRIYTYSVGMLDSPIRYESYFIMNMRDEKLAGHVIYSIHFKSSPTMDLKDLEKYNLGEIREILDVQNMYCYPTPFLRPMLQELYNSGYSGYHLN